MARWAAPALAGGVHGDPDLLEQMCVGVECRGRRRAPGHPLDDLHVRAGRDREARRSVARLVRMQVGNEGSARECARGRPRLSPPIHARPGDDDPIAKEVRFQRRFLGYVRGENEWKGNPAGAQK